MGSAKVLTVVAASFALIVPAANAQSPSLEGYTGPGGGVLDDTTKGGTPPTTTVPTETGGVLDETASGGPGGTTAVAPGGGSGGSEQPVATQQAAGNGGGQLPFTGFDVAIMAAVGALLLALGVGIRFVSRPARSAKSA
jgi:hypothetical protein